VEARALDPGELADLAIYLRFLGTGEIAAREDGGHHRPSHHARAARRIHEGLRRSATPETAWLLRKIEPWLPSFGRAFTVAEPLTRIRDIAHRNHIPQELKREIKHTLQNKLHRNAGPEDLVTSSRLLERVAAPGAGLPPGFVKEFRRFHRELREFFNASSLEERLAALAAREPERLGPAIRGFLEAKEEDGALDGQLALLERLVALRRDLAGAGARADAGGEAERQRREMADLGLDEFSFVVLSRLVASLDGGEGLPWSAALRSLSLAVEGLGLSGFAPEACRAVTSELSAWSRGFDPRDREQLLRLKATLERCREFADRYQDRVLALFSGRAERLGQALGVAEEARRVFCEADIRAHPVFPLSGLAGLVLGRIRRSAGLPAWDVLVPGSARGELVWAPELAEWASARPAVVLVDRVEGDEELPPGASALLTPRETPHLSHLAVRARQAGVAFAVCGEPAVFAAWRGLAGKEVALEAGAAGVWLEPLPAPGRLTGPAPIPGNGPRAPAPLVLTPGDLPAGGPVLLPLEGVTAETAGNKAWGARRLRELCQDGHRGFLTPESRVLPFSTLEEALAREPALREEVRSLVRRLDQEDEAGLPPLLERLRDRIDRLPVPAEAVEELTRAFGARRLMVRSSSNGEDAEGMAGAGIYGSEANVAAPEVAGAVRAVWASLWSVPAALGRRRAGIPQGSARMGVLVQEMLCPDYAFVAHTVHPTSGDPEEALLEIAVGLGETLVSGRVPGSPYRALFHKGTGAAEILAFGSFGEAVRPGAEGGVVSEVLDYSAVRLSADPAFLRRTAARLGEAACAVEAAFGKPQDIEGVLSGDELYLVQARPQQLRVPP
jgi:phosphoglucan,water dikinase